MIRHLRSLGLAVGLSSLAAIASAGGGPEYQAVILEPWDTTYPLAISRASGINDMNQVSGAATPISGSSSFLWTLGGGMTQVALGGKINDQGVVAGANAVMWPDGTIEVFDLLSVAQDINELNVVAGTWGTLSCSASSNDDAGVWDQVNGTQLLTQDFGILDAEHARAINDNNQVVGVRTPNGGCGSFKAFYFDLKTQTYVDIHTELVGGALALTEAFDINDAGFVVGEGPNGGTVKPFLWHASSGFTFLPAPPNGTQIDTHFDGINNLNQAVGGAIVSDGAGGLGVWHAVIWDAARGTRDLNDLVDVLPPDFTVDGAREINDNGWIIASGHYGAWSPERAVILIPLEAPVAYCTPKTSSAGCVAGLATSPSGLPTSGAGGYSVDAAAVQGGKNGLLFAGVTGPAATPFSGGTLCVNPPLKRGPLLNSGGTGPNTCDGTYSTEVNDGAILPLGLDAGAGNTGWYQYWYRDPGNGLGPLGTALSAGVEIDFL